MIAEFLKAEINSKRFGKYLLEALKRCKSSKRIVESPRLYNKQENKLRKQILREYRGYSRNEGLFKNFPTKVNWERVSLSLDDLERVKYIDYEYWIELSGGSRLATDAVKNIKAGFVVFDQSNELFFEVAKVLRKRKTLPLLILVSTDKNGYVVILEGHLRLTAYLLEPESISAPVEAIIGYSRDFTKWGLY